MLARNPALASVGGTLACVRRDVPVDGLVRVQFSDNHFDSWRCDRMLDQDIKGNSFSLLALDSDRLLMVHDRGGFPLEGRGTPARDGIEVAMMRRNPAVKPVTAKLIPSERRDSGELNERVTVPMATGLGETTVTPQGEFLAWSGGHIYRSQDRGRTFEVIADAPTADYNAGVFGELRSGRWLIVATDWSLLRPGNWDGNRESKNSDDGYAYFDLSGVNGVSRVWTYYSDDRGQTWHGGRQPMELTPLVWANPYGRFIEEPDGTVVMPAYGCLTHDDTAGRIDCCGLYRSTDSGRTWGDFTLVFHDELDKEIAYNEFDVQPLPDGRWVAVIRTEWQTHHAGEAASASVSFSPDRGRTWDTPEYAFIGAVSDMALLPDGALAWVGSMNLARLSYDGGHTWSLEIPAHADIGGGTGYPGPELVDRNHLFMCGRWKGRRGCIYRRVPTTGARLTPNSRTPGSPVGVGANSARDAIHVGKPRKLPATLEGAERIPIGIADDYKPCLAHLNGTELLLVGFQTRGGVPAEYTFQYQSADGGRTWSERQKLDILGQEPYLSKISDGTLFISTHVLPAARGNDLGYTFSSLYRSTDGGRTWDGTKILYDHILRQQRKDGKAPDTAPAITGRNVLELRDGTLVFAVGSQHGPEMLWRSADRGETWDKTQTCEFDTLDIARYPYSVLQEATLSQARNGDLLAVCRVASRTARDNDPRETTDHYERMALYRSRDEGRNWTYEEIGSHYGEMYQSLLRLRDKRLLFTFTVRAAVPPNIPPLGVRAVIRDETPWGFQFDFRHDRIVLDTKTPSDKPSGGGFGPTVQLDDGTLVTTCSYRQSDNQTRCEVVRWRLP